MTKTKSTAKPSQLRAAILETAEGMQRAEIMSAETNRKITARQEAMSRS